MTVDGEETLVGAGSLVFVEIGEIHGLFKHGDSDIEFYAVTQPAWAAADHLIETDAT